HVGQQVFDVGGLVGARGLAGGRRGGRGGIGLGSVGDGEQAGVRRDRARVLAHQLHAVVVHRVVAGGDHHAAGGVEVVDLEVDLLGAAQADVDDLPTLAAQAGRQRRLQAGAAQAHVV